MKMGTEALVLGTPCLPCLVALLRGPAGEWNPSIGSVGTCYMWGCPLLTKLWMPSSWHHEVLCQHFWQRLYGALYSHLQHRIKAGESLCAAPHVPAQVCFRPDDCSVTCDARVWCELRWETSSTGFT